MLENRDPMKAKKLHALFLTTLPALVAGAYVLPGCSAGTTTSTFASEDGGEAGSGPVECGGCGCGDGGNGGYSVTVDGGLPSTTDAGNAGDGGDGGDTSFDGGAAYDGEVLSQAQCDLVCHGGAVSCTVTSVSPALVVNCVPGCLGREPAGLLEGTRTVSSLGEYFSEMARIEEASVFAFRRMARELRAFGAPASLVRSAHRAARDEIAHTRMAGSMARRFGAEPSRPMIDAPMKRSLFAFAMENEIEGCVRETFGALTGMHQAQFADDPRIRAMMSVIARDEARHASLSQRVSTWARRRLTQSESRKLDVARDEAFAKTQNDFLRAPLTPWQRALGLPTAAASRTLLDALQSQEERRAA